ncbi:hypothetical protein L7F22_042561 [Adiantum nelumboides]|nr:hypothetical protein [Adiantum nelumboides]
MLSDDGPDLVQMTGSGSWAGFERECLSEQVKRSEQEVAASAAREKALQERYKLDLDRSEGRFRMQLNGCEDLEVKLQQELRLRAEAELKADAASSQLDDLRISSAKSTEKLKKEITTLEERLRRMQKDAQYALLKTESRASAEKSKVQYAESEIEHLKGQCEDLQALLSKCMDEKRTLSHQLANTTTDTSSSHNKEMEVVIKHLRDELKSFVMRLTSKQHFDFFIYENVTDTSFRTVKSCAACWFYGTFCITGWL